MAISGLPGGAIDHSTGGIIRPPSGEVHGVSRPGQQPGGIANGSIVEGLVTGANGENYMVRIGAQLMNARSTIPLFVGQRFRAVWDSTQQPPMLRLQASDMAVISRFSGRDREVAYALLSRGLPVNDGVMQSIRQSWMASGANSERLGVMAELWARGIQMTDQNIALFSWYMGLAPDEALRIWKKIKDKMRAGGWGSAQELLESLREEDDPEVAQFMKAHAMAGKPARRGLDPAMLLAPAWWPVDDEEGGGAMARVSLAHEEEGGVRVAWMNFELEGLSLGLVRGDVMTNERALSANIRVRDEDSLPIIEDALPELREELSEIPLPLQHLGVSALRDGEIRDRARAVGLDMEI